MATAAHAHAPATAPDRFTYDPMNPVPTLGGYRVGSDPEGRGGSFDQRKIQERDDVLVYTSEAFKEGTEVAGPIMPTLYVSSDVKDTDFTVKIIDVYPDGRASTWTSRSSAYAIATATTSPWCGWSGQGLQGDAAAVGDEQLLPAGAPAARRSEQQ